MKRKIDTSGNPIPVPGDRVRFTRKGLEGLFGNTLGLGHMLTKEMTITEVGEESMTEPEDTYIVRVDDPEIDVFLLDHRAFRIVSQDE